MTPKTEAVLATLLRDATALLIAIAISVFDESRARDAPAPKEKGS